MVYGVFNLIVDELNATDFRLVFVAIRGFHVYSAIGVDNVNLTEGSCSRALQCMLCVMLSHIHV